MIKLYKKTIWNDQKTVNIIAHGCLSESYKIKLIACYFLIETTQPPEELSDSDEDDGNLNPYEIKD